MIATPRFLKVRRVADELGMSRKHIYGLIARGELRACRIGGKLLRVDRADMEAYVEASKVREAPADAKSPAAGIAGSLLAATQGKGGSASGTALPPTTDDNWRHHLHELVGTKGERDV